VIIMVRTWQLQEAKNKFSQVVDEAVRDGPQIITRHGVETAVVISIEDYRHHHVGKEKLTKFLRESPLAEYKLDMTRDPSPPRDETVS
jgi:prevent-host-death family protein